MEVKLALKILLGIAFVVSVAVLVKLSASQAQLESEIERLEAELGHMTIDDPDRIHIVEITNPDVPPEVMSHLLHVWQFRCYLPAGYDYRRLSCGGRIARSGLYANGGYSSSQSSPSSMGNHKLLTLSLQEMDGQVQVYCSFDGAGGTSSWGGFGLDGSSADLVVEKLASRESGPRSFDKGAILPLLRVYDRNSAETKDVNGAEITTYAGGFIAFVPMIRESVFNELKSGVTPAEFKADWLAEVEKRDE